MENFIFCAVGTAIENNMYYFLHFSNFSSVNTFLNKMTSIDRSINEQDKRFFYRNPTYSTVNNKFISECEFKECLRRQQI